MGCTPVKKSIVVSSQQVIPHSYEKIEITKHKDVEPKLIRKYTHMKSLGGNTNNLQGMEGELTPKNKMEGALQREYTKKNPTLLKSTQNYKTEANTNEQIIVSKEKLDSSDITLIKDALLGHFLFKELTSEIVEKILSKFILFQINAGDTLFTEEDEGNFFFIMKQGEMELIIKNLESTKVLAKGDCFGELSLIQKNKRSGTVKCLKDAEIFCLEGPVFRDIVQKINKYDMKERIFFLNLIPIFKGLNNMEIQNVARGMVKCQYGEGHIILKEGEKGESLFIIKEGVVSCIKNGKELRRLYTKDYFGENSILFETKRSLSIVSMFKTSCYQISKTVLQEILGEGDNFKNTLLLGICKESFQNAKYMRYFLISDLFTKKIFSCFKLSFYQNSQVVIPVENKNEKVFILIEGNLGDANTRQTVATRGELYGDILLAKSEQLSFDIIAMTDCIILEAEWSQIVTASGLKFEERKVLSFLIRLSHLRKVQIFKHVSDQRLTEILYIMNKQKFKNGEEIMKFGEQGDYLYLIYKGKAKVYKDGRFLREIEEGGCFGEMSLLLNQPHSATVVASGNVSTYKLSKQDFNKCFDKNMYDFLLHKISLQDGFGTNLENFYFIKKLGEGKFGLVFLVHNGRYIYALKAVNRRAAEKQKILIKYICKEKMILLSLDHPFIVKLVKTLKNEDYIFYLMEHVNGVQLRKYLENREDTQVRNKYETQFYIASLLVAVNYLNSKRIAHRDIKPDNIMLDEKGYIKLIDFGTSIIIKDFTTTIVGTPHYIAPEVLLGKGYSFSADYWSIGITAFEIYFNYYPFGNKAYDPMEIYREVVKKELVFPPDFKEEKIISFLSMMLKKKTTERACNMEYIKHLNFFHDFNWDELIDFQLNAPFTPGFNINPQTALSNKKVKFLDELAKINLKDSVLSSYDDNLNEFYDPAWADQF